MIQALLNLNPGSVIFNLLGLNPVLAEAYTLTTLVTDVGSIITALMGWLTSVMTTALSSPIVIAFIALAVAGVAVGFAKKLLHF